MEEALGSSENKNQESKAINWNVKSRLENVQRYVLDVKESKGEFFDFVNDLILPKLSVVPSYNMEKFKPSFKPEYKELWKKSQMLCILSLLYHSGLVQMSLRLTQDYLLRNNQIKGLDDINK